MPTAVQPSPLTRTAAPETTSPRPSTAPATTTTTTTTAAAAKRWSPVWTAPQTSSQCPVANHQCHLPAKQKAASSSARKLAAPRRSATLSSRRTSAGAATLLASAVPRRWKSQRSSTRRSSPWANRWTPSLTSALRLSRISGCSRRMSTGSSLPLSHATTRVR